jgi:hypothetical protein
MWLATSVLRKKREQFRVVKDRDMDTEQIPATRIEVGHVIRRVDGREVEWHVWNVWLNEETINIRYWSSDDCVRIHAFAADAKVVVSPKKLDAKTFLRIRLQRLQKGKGIS